MRIATNEDREECEMISPYDSSLSSLPYVSVGVWKSCVSRTRGRVCGRTREHQTSPKAIRDIRYISPCGSTTQCGECLSESLPLLEGEWEGGRGRENPGRFLRLGATLLALSHSSPPGFTCARHATLQATPAGARVGLPESRACQCRRVRTVPAPSHVSESR